LRAKSNYKHHCATNVIDAYHKSDLRGFRKTAHSDANTMMPW